METNSTTNPTAASRHVSTAQYLYAADTAPTNASLSVAPLLKKRGSSSAIITTNLAKLATPKRPVQAKQKGYGDHHAFAGVLH